VSEHEEETQEQIGEPADDDTQLEPDDELADDEEHEQPDEGDALEPGAEPGATVVRDDRDLEALRKKLDNEDIRHSKRIAEIFGDDAPHLLQCPMCLHLTAGFLFPPDAAPIPEENVALIRSLIGMPAKRTLKRHPSFTTCPECEGEGSIDTGSHRIGYDESACPGCAGKGWVGIGASANGPQTGTAGTATATVTPLQAVEDEDPEIARLRARGFLVVAPTKIGG
jgi:hypothetical protein